MPAEPGDAQLRVPFVVLGDAGLDDSQLDPGGRRRLGAVQAPGTRADDQQRQQDRGGERCPAVGGARREQGCRADEEAVILTVRDSGVGMDAEALARVFEPYFSTKSSGTGLGLPIARRNVELSGGTIEVESQKGQGTTVRVRLPVASPAAPEASSTPDQ